MRSIWLGLHGRRKLTAYLLVSLLLLNVVGFSSLSIDANAQKSDVKCEWKDALKKVLKQIKTKHTDLGGGLEGWDGETYEETDDSLTIGETSNSEGKPTITGKKIKFQCKKLPAEGGMKKGGETGIPSDPNGDIPITIDPDVFKKEWKLKHVVFHELVHAAQFRDASSALWKFKAPEKSTPTGGTPTREERARGAQMAAFEIEAHSKTIELKKRLMEEFPADKADIEKEIAYELKLIDWYRNQLKNLLYELKKNRDWWNEFGEGLLQEVTRAIDNVKKLYEGQKDVKKQKEYQLFIDQLRASFNKNERPFASSWSDIPDGTRTRTHFDGAVEAVSLDGKHSSLSDPPPDPTDVSSYAPAPAPTAPAPTAPAPAPTAPDPVEEIERALRIEGDKGRTETIEKDGTRVITYSNGATLTVSPNGDWEFRTKAPERITLEDGTQIIKYATGSIEVIGTGKGEKITGTDKGDILSGQGGDDTLEGGDGNDLILGGAGNDILNGGRGRDNALGGTGDDTIIINRGDVPAGETENIFGGHGTDKAVLDFEPEIGFPGPTLTVIKDPDTGGYYLLQDVELIEVRLPNGTKYTVKVEGGKVEKVDSDGKKSSMSLPTKDFRIDEGLSIEKVHSKITALSSLLSDPQKYLQSIQEGGGEKPTKVEKTLPNGVKQTTVTTGDSTTIWEEYPNGTTVTRHIKAGETFLIFISDPNGIHWIVFRDGTIWRVDRTGKVEQIVPKQAVSKLNVMSKIAGPRFGDIESFAVTAEHGRELMFSDGTKVTLAASDLGIFSCGTKVLDRTITIPNCWWMQYILEAWKEEELEVREEATGLAIILLKNEATRIYDQVIEELGEIAYAVIILDKPSSGEERENELEDQSPIYQGLREAAQSDNPEVAARAQAVLAWEQNMRDKVGINPHNWEKGTTTPTLPLQQEESSKTMQPPKEPKWILNPDGSKERTLADGSRERILADGTREIIHPNGSWERYETNGTIERYWLEGPKLKEVVYANGTVETVYSDGTTSTINPKTKESIPPAAPTPKVPTEPAGAGISGADLQTKSFPVQVIGEGIEGLTFNSELGTIKLGSDGTEGTVEVKIPKELLTGKLNVLADGKPIESQLYTSLGEPEATLVITRPAGTSFIEIVGEEPLGKLPKGTIVEPHLQGETGSMAGSGISGVITSQEAGSTTFLVNVKFMSDKSGKPGTPKPSMRYVGITMNIIDKESKLPLSDVTVTIYDKSGKILNAKTTGSDGVTGFVLLTGDYSVTVKARGYGTLKEGFSIKGDLQGAVELVAS